MPKRIQEERKTNGSQHQKNYKSPAEIRESDRRREKYLRIQFFLRKIAVGQHIPEITRHRPLLRYLTETAKELLMNEMEVIMWAVILEKVVLRQDTPKLQELILFSAYYVKSHLNNEMDDIDSFLVKKYKDFKQAYEFWHLQNVVKIQVSPIELNRKFTQLSSRRQIMHESWLDYNYYVDDILQIAPPTVAIGEESEVPTLSFTEEMQLPTSQNIMRLDSVIGDMRADEYAMLPNFSQGYNGDAFEDGFSPAKMESQYGDLYG